MPEGQRDWYYQQPVIDEFRANGGKVGGYYLDTQLLLLTTTGARSGLPHVTPLSYMADGDRYIVAAANGGAPGHPDWYHNLVANRRASVEVGTDKFDATAVVVTGEERDDLFERVVDRYPQLWSYQVRTTRQIPLVALTGIPHSQDQS